MGSNSLPYVSTTEVSLSDIDSAGSLERALGWIETSRKEFAFSRHSDPRTQLLLLKPFSELMLCVEVLSSHGIEWDHSKEISSWAWDEVAQGDYLFRLIAARPDLCQLAGLASSFASLGFRNDRLEQLLASIGSMRTNHYAAIEPWLRWSVTHAYRRLGIAGPNRSGWAESWLFSMSEPWTISSQTAYAVTHEIFYATDFGRRPAEGLDDSRLGYLELWLPVWISHFADIGNFDLVGELCMAADMLLLGAPRAALRAMLASQTHDGAFPGPDGAGGELLRTARTQQEREFFQAYHTTLVGSMALAINQTLDVDHSLPSL